MVTKMDREDRAKQFTPFAALKGYPEALKLEEQVRMPQPELCEEYQEELNRKLCRLQRGDVVTVNYYRSQSCRRLTGTVERVDRTARILIVGDTKIPFDRLYRISEEV